MVRELSHYIDGQMVDGTSTRFGDVYNPCTGEVQARLPLASADEVRNAIASAEKGQIPRMNLSASCWKSLNRTYSTPPKKLVATPSRREA